MGDADPASSEPVTQSGAKTAKKNFEKVAKKKPDPAGLALGEEAQAALTAKDFGAAKDLFTQAQTLCEASDVKPAKQVKPAKPSEGASEGAAAKHKPGKGTADEPEVQKEVNLPAPGSDGHRVAKNKANLGDLPNYAVNIETRLNEHLVETNSKWRTRFPPEPNGYLHIGHAKAMHFDFGVAKRFGGETYLRFDDTNPDAEKQEYIDSILSSVAWLGHTPAKVTYSSNYFDKLHSLAIELIKKGKAYVCHQTKLETAASRQLLQGFQLKCAREGLAKKDTELPPGAASPHRERSVEENLELFRQMTAGELKEGECSLRMKGDLRSDITSMWDLAAYRIKFAVHPHSGDKYVVYPTYDYTHCLVDSLENITHSLCTLEFETRQAPNGPYYWLLDALDMYKPVTWEFARCNITYNVMSKRKLNRLVTDGFVAGWDDPRLLTLEGLRRRGYTPSSVNAFCEELGVTRNDNVQHLSKLEKCIRDELEENCDRIFGVLDPIPVDIVNHPGVELPVSCPLHPKFLDRGNRIIQLTKTVFVERSDFREVDDSNFFGLAPNKAVRLLFGYNITCVGFEKDESGKVTRITATYDPESLGTKPPKGTLHWASTEFVQTEVRVYDKLFAVEVPGCVEGGKELEPAVEPTVDGEEPHEKEAASELWLTQINPDSLITHFGALVEPSLSVCAGEPLSKRFQLQRLGYFTFDKDSTHEKPVLNRIVTLKESKDLKAMKK
jgi:glutaminyl-tRNA synthetase|tara:strand:+ start:1791 stop:3965 length:2175 start_codon:yes stop_codon:yes gene_type:complete